MLAEAILGLDGTSGETKRASWEKDPVVIKSILSLVKKVKKINKGVFVTLDRSELFLLEDLIKLGVTAVSVSNYMLEETRDKISDIEARLVLERR